MRLTKSEFMQGRTCHQRVVYQREGIESRNDGNKMMRELAEHGQIIHYLYRNHRRSALLGASLEQLIAEAPQKSHEVELSAHGFEARADMINITGRAITLVEVKSEAYPTDGNGRLIPLFTSQGEVSSAFSELIADVAYQALILEDMLATMKLQRPTPYQVNYELVLVHPRIQTPAQLLRQTFDVYKGVVSHAGDWQPSQLLKMFARVDVTDAVRKMMPSIDAERREMQRKLEQREPPILSSKCKSCEFRTTIVSEEPNGFLGCWRDMAFNYPHALDVPNVHNVKIKGEDAVSVLARQGKALPADIPADAFKSGYNNMQERVVRAFVTDEEQQEPELRGILEHCAAPHAFIDVEAYSGPLSLWEGGRPYEITAFQWSCHIIDSDGALQHYAWLHEDSEHPAAAFLTSMHDVLKSAGTVYIWSGYERTAVAHALRAASALDYELDADVRAWATDFADNANSNVVDMLDLAKKYYVHPGARGSNSIKKVLDAIWKQHYRRFMSQFPEYYERHEGFISSPYLTLPVNYESARLATIRDGAEAMVAYQDMLHGGGRQSPIVRENLRHALLEYCKLDTAAMVIIYQQWMDKC